MQTEICFIRHGETEWNHQTRIQGTIDNHLNANGINQAHAVANYFLNQDKPWDFIVSSPLTRAMQTADIIATTLSLQPIIILDAFREREFGLAEGQVISKALFDKILMDDIEGLEKTKDIQKRVMDTTLRLAEMHEGKRILVVAHSHVIKALITFLNKRYSFRYKIYNSALTSFVYENKKLHITSINQEVSIEE